MFIPNESYKHLYAKELLFRWLCDAERNYDFYARVAQFQWRPNYGVHKELKFHDTDDDYYFECSQGLVIGDDGGFSFDPNFKRGKILFVPDICVFHKGTPWLLFEIKHTHPVPDYKIKAIDAFLSCAELYEIEADSILNLTGVPDYIDCQQLL